MNNICVCVPCALSIILYDRIFGENILKTLKPPSKSQ